MWQKPELFRRPLTKTDKRSDAFCYLPPSLGATGLHLSIFKNLACIIWILLVLKKQEFRFWVHNVKLSPTNLLVLYCLRMALVSLWDARLVNFGDLLWSECKPAHLIYMLKSQAPRDGGLWCGPCGLMRVWGRSLLNRISGLIKEAEVNPSPSCHLRIQEKSVVSNQEAGAHRNLPCWHLPWFEFRPLGCEQEKSAPEKLLSLCYVVNGVWMVWGMVWPIFCVESIPGVQKIPNEREILLPKCVL